MENLPTENQSVASRLNFFLFLPLGLVILILIGVGVYYFKLTEEKKKSEPISNCLILKEKYCNKGKKLLYNDKFPMIGFNLPANTVIYSPLAGKVTLSTAIFKKDGKSYPYTSILIDGGELTYALVFDYDVANQTKDQVGQNQVLAKLNSKTIDFFGNYNLIVYVMKKEENLLTIDAEQTLKLFNMGN